MKFSSNIELCTLSPIRKFHPYVVKAEAKGLRVHHLNIGQPDIETPPVFFEAVGKYADAVLAYAPSAGMEDFLAAIQSYYSALGVSLEEKDILATFGGSEALQMAMSCLLEAGDEILVAEPFYTNSSTFINFTGARPSSTNIPGPFWLPTPATPPAPS